MRKLTFTLVIITLFINANAQQKKIDSLKKIIAVAKDDTNKVITMNNLGGLYVYSKPDSAFSLALQEEQLSKNIHYLTGEGKSLNLQAIVYDVKGNYPKALVVYFAALKIFEQLNDRLRIGKVWGNIGVVYKEQGDIKQAIKYELRVKKANEAVHDDKTLVVILLDLGADYYDLKMLDSGMYYSDQAYRLAIKLGDADNSGIAAGNLGDIYAGRQQFDKALYYYRKAISYEKQAGDDDNWCGTILGLAGVFKQTGTADSALYYGRQAIAISRQGGFTDRVLAASQFLTTYFKGQGKLDSAFHYQEIYITAKDSLFSQEKTRAIQNLIFDERQRQQDIQGREAAYRASIRYYLMGAAIVFLLVLAIVFWRNNRKNKKARHLLQLQKEQIQIALGELKATQTQLVQREKMASLGELTAGIAHEIQNPLNFVNNFSEVSVELLNELKEEAEAGNKEDVIAIAGDLTQNLQKINHHGKRADSIVKGMLEHSRVGPGEKGLVDINALADEFFKLSYHGLKAKDKSFNAELVARFDDNLPKLNVASQDIGRVLLNLFNNAFYAVNQKEKTAGPGYNAKVEVTTFAPPSGGWGIKVRDNGNGIPQNVLDKIYQPFFTTKPTGEGTGLGLSLSYDIVVKGHGGKLEVNTKEGEYTEFTVTLPTQ